MEDSVDNASTMSTPMVVTRTPFDEDTPQKKAIKYGTISVTVIFLLLAIIWGVVEGFDDNLHFTFALQGFALLMLTVTTFALLWRINREDIDESAKIPVYIQTVALLLLGCSILYGINDIACKDHNPYIESLSCYEEVNTCLVYEKTGTSSSGQSEFKYQCVTASKVVNTTSSRCTFTTQSTTESTLAVMSSASGRKGNTDGDSELLQQSYQPDRPSFAGLSGRMGNTVSKREESKKGRKTESKGAGFVSHVQDWLRNMGPRNRRGRHTRSDLRRKPSLVRGRRN